MTAIHVSQDECKGRVYTIKRWLALLMGLLLAMCVGVWVYVASAAEMRVYVTTNTDAIKANRLTLERVRSELDSKLEGIRRTTQTTAETVAEIKGLLKKRNGN